MKRDPALQRVHLALIASIDEAIGAVDRRPPIPDAAVHAARKAIKKARAALRLLRASLGEEEFEKENARLRAAGRRLSPLRDAKSLIDAYRTLRDRYPEQLRQPGRDPLAGSLRASRLTKRKALFGTAGALKSCIRSLEACRSGAAKWRPSAAGPSVLTAGQRRIHRAGRKALARARKERTPQALHEWRKQVKYLSNALAVLGVARAGAPAKAAARTGKLGDRLGDDHDLAELARHIAGDATPIDPSARNKLAALIGRRRAKLQKQAFALGAKIYGEKPGRFVARLQQPQKAEATTAPETKKNKK